MRKIIDLQMEFWRKDIADIEFDLESRDEIPKLLMGLQYIYRTGPIRKKVFEVLKQIVPRKNHERRTRGLGAGHARRICCDRAVAARHRLQALHHRAAGSGGPGARDREALHVAHLSRATAGRVGEDHGRDALLRGSVVACGDAGR